jgi:hypothetical protein
MTGDLLAREKELAEVELRLDAQEAGSLDPRPRRRVAPP